MFNALAKLISFKTADLEAKLSGVAGFTGYGELEYSSWSNGHVSYEVELRGVAGTKAEIYVNNEFVSITPVNNGKSDQNFDTRRGHAYFLADVGDKVEIRQHGDVILEGAFVND